ncbi:MAG: ATP-binding cassette domain-containing protein, partial [Actinobacteria bacterium]|nr:ATP-binding cassette domain-containing protein [Actinomycetota bacterium]
MSVNFDTPRGSLEAVRGVDIEIPAGMSVGVVGESGSGKTVMCRAAMGLLQGSTVSRTGTVIFDGHELTAMSKDQVRELFGSGMAMIFQDPLTALNPVRRIGAQLSEGLRIRLGMTKSDAMARSKELLELVRIPNAAAVLKSFPYQLSGG